MAFFACMEGGLRPRWDVKQAMKPEPSMRTSSFQSMCSTQWWSSWPPEHEIHKTEHTS